MPKPQKWVIVMSSEFYKVCDMIKKIGHIIDDPKESFPWYSICVCLETLRMQKVAIVPNEKEYFGIPVVIFLGISYIGTDDVDPVIIRECMVSSRLMAMKKQKVDGDWSYTRLENGTNLLGFGIIIPITDKLNIDDLAEAITCIAKTADMGEQKISGDQDVL